MQNLCLAGPNQYIPSLPNLCFFEHCSPTLIIYTHSPYFLLVNHCDHAILPRSSTLSQGHMLSFTLRVLLRVVSVQASNSCQRAPCHHHPLCVSFFFAHLPSLCDKSGIILGSVIQLYQESFQFFHLWLNHWKRIIYSCS